MVNVEAFSHWIAITLREIYVGTGEGVKFYWRLKFLVAGRKNCVKIYGRLFNCEIEFGKFVTSIKSEIKF